MHLSGNEMKAPQKSGAVERAAQRARVVNDLPVLIAAENDSRRQAKKTKDKDRDRIERAPIKVMGIEYMLGEASERKRIRLINAALQAKGESAFTGLKLGNSPIAALLERRKIGGEELTAAQEIETAFMAISGAMMIKPLAMERVSSGGKSPDFPERTSKAIARYQAWANHWSVRSKRGDKTLEIAIAAIIDMRPFSVIEADVGIRHGMAQKVTIRALRDYAARAGWAEGGNTKRWKDEAEQSFPVVPVELAYAMARARVLADSE